MYANPFLGPLYAGGGDTKAGGGGGGGPVSYIVGLMALRLALFMGFE